MLLSTEWSGGQLTQGEEMFRTTLETQWPILSLANENYRSLNMSWKQEGSSLEDYASEAKTILLEVFCNPIQILASREKILLQTQEKNSTIEKPSLSL